jgi:hypothetical protein
MLGTIPILRFLWYYFAGSGDGHVQSLVLGGMLVVIAFLSFLFGLVADLIGFNRQLIEITLEKVRRIELRQAESLVEADDAQPLRYRSVK